VRARHSRRSSVDTLRAVGGVLAVVGEDLDGTVGTPDIRVAGGRAVRVPLGEGAVPVDRCGFGWRFGCRRAGGFNTGDIVM